MTRILSSLSFAFVLFGCGLTLDLDPPDPSRDGTDAGPGIDAGDLMVDSGASDASHSMDSGANDASASMDSGHVDAADSGSTDSGSTDSGSTDSGSTDSGVDLCTGAVNGTLCGSAIGRRLICLGGACVVGRCGDDFRDMGAGEECDDGNEIPGDGCEPFACVLTCESRIDCADSNRCNGEERCESNVCMAGTPVTSDSCMLRDGSDGVCGTTGLCVPVGCGNGITESGEECDDENATPNDGCENDCTRSCRSAADCDDGDFCNGLEICNTERGCSRGPTPLCAIPDACHTVSCDARMGCVTTRIDADGDGHSPISHGACGDDCDDTRADVYKDAPEQCGNRRDDDCDTRIDESTVSFNCYPDEDRDGFGDWSDAVHACMCPEGTITTAGDCFDVMGDPASSLVNPTQTAFFTNPYCTSSADCHFDYDCNGREERRFATVFDRCRLLAANALCAGTGWEGEVPACGATANWVECELGLDLLGALLCRARTTVRVQPCR